MVHGYRSWRAAVPHWLRADPGRALALAGFAVGTVLIVLQFTARSSIWLDELALLDNVRRSGLVALIAQPLDRDQTAPVLFLGLFWLLDRLPIAVELSARLQAFSFSLLSLWVSVLLGRRVLRGWPTAVPVIALSLSAQAIWLSGQAKPYAGDVLVAAWLLYVALTPSIWDRHRGKAMVAAITVAPWISLPSIFFLPGVLFGRSAAWSRPVNRSWIQHLRGVLPIAISAAGAVVTSRIRVSDETYTYLQWFWSDTVPRASWVSLVKWPAYETRLLLQQLSNGSLGHVHLMLAVLGVAWLWRQSRQQCVIIVLPIVGAYAASLLGLYPVSSRLGMFLVPALATLLGAGLAFLGGVRTLRPAAALMGIVLAGTAGAALLRFPPPYSFDRWRSLMPMVRARMQRGDRVYVSFASTMSIRLYGADLDDGQRTVVWGGCHVGRTEGYVRELLPFAQQGRVWMLGRHPEGLRDKPMRLVAEHMGRRIEEIQLPGIVAPEEEQMLPPSAGTATATLYDFDRAVDRAELEQLVSGLDSTWTFRGHPLKLECRGPWTSHTDSASPPSNH